MYCNHRDLITTKKIEPFYTELIYRFYLGLFRTIRYYVKLTHAFCVNNIITAACRGLEKSHAAARVRIRLVIMALSSELEEKKNALNGREQQYLLSMYKL